jgi:hypothetical protein
MATGNLQPFGLIIGKYAPIAMEAFNAIKTTKAIKTKKAINISIAAETIVFLYFIVCYPFLAYTGSV